MYMHVHGRECYAACVRVKADLYALMRKGILMYCVSSSKSSLYNNVYSMILFLFKDI